jgi:hypothetical protein
VTATVTVNLANFVATNTAQVWQLTSANIINHLSDVAVSGNALTTTVPAQSITLFVLPPGAVAPPPPPPEPVLTGARMTSSNTVTFWLTNGVAGLSYVIQSSTDLTNTNWPPLQTNTLTTSSNSYVFPAADTARFYRAKWVP